MVSSIVLFMLVLLLIIRRWLNSFLCVVCGCVVRFGRVFCVKWWVWGWSFCNMMVLLLSLLNISLLICVGVLLVNSLIFRLMKVIVRFVLIVFFNIVLVLVFKLEGIFIVSIGRLVVLVRWMVCVKGLCMVFVRLVLSNVFIIMFLSMVYLF